MKNPESTKQSLGKQKSVGAILFVAGMALIWGVAITVGSTGSMATIMGRVTGQTLVVGLVVFLVLALTPLRKRVSMALVLAIIWFGLSALTSIAIYEVHSKSQKLGRATLDVIESVASGEKIESDPSTSDSLESWLTNFVARVQQISTDYQNDLTLVLNEEVLSAQNLADTDKAKESLVEVNRLLEVIPKYEEATIEAFGAAKTFLSKRTDAIGRRTYQGFMKKYAEGIQNVREQYDNEETSLTVIGGMLEFAIANEGRFDVVDGQLMFEDQQQLDTYNALLTRLSEQAEKDERRAAEKQQTLQELKEWTRAQLD